MSLTCESSETFKIKILPFGSACSPTMSQCLFVAVFFLFESFTQSSPFLWFPEPHLLARWPSFWAQAWLFSVKLKTPEIPAESPVYFISQEACYLSVLKKRNHSIRPGPLPSTPPLFSVHEDLPQSLTVLLNLEMQNIQWLLISFRVGVILLF